MCYNKLLERRCLVIDPIKNDSKYDTYQNHSNHASVSGQMPHQDRSCSNAPSLEPGMSDEEFIRAWNAFFAKPENTATAQTMVSDDKNSEERSIIWETSKEAKSTIQPKKHRIVRKILASLILLTILYCVAVFSNLPFIAKWRTIYIETAMGTMNHQWLATAFIPDSVIDKVMLDRSNMEENQSGLESNWSISSFSKNNLYLPWKKEKKVFAKIYHEIDQETFHDYIKEHSDEILNTDDYMVIDQAGLEDDGTTIQTVYGDQVLAIDTENAITIIKVIGDGYVGRLAIVKDPSRVGVGLSSDFGEKGALIEDIAQDNNAILAINASGFYDPSGHGDGGRVFGLVMQGGKILNQALGGTDKVVGFNRKNKLMIGNSELATSLRDAVEFKPALIINNEVLVTGTAGWGIQPRSVIGQTKNGEVLLLVVDGRAPGYSIGCTIGEAAQIMKRYGAVQAINLDGGSSSIMYYNGREITKPSAANKTKGRNIPDGFVVCNR